MMEITHSDCYKIISTKGKETNITYVGTVRQVELWKEFAESKGYTVVVKEL